MGVIYWFDGGVYGMGVIMGVMYGVGDGVWLLE